MPWNYRESVSADIELGEQPERIKRLLLPSERDAAARLCSTGMHSRESKGVFAVARKCTKSKPHEDLIGK